MSIFSKLGYRKDKPPKNTESVEFKRYMGKKLNERHIRYLLERDETNEERVIARDGFIAVTGDELAILCDGMVKFRTLVDKMEAWEFMSLEGVTITGFDLDENKTRTVMAYYKYYRD